MSPREAAEASVPFNYAASTPRRRLEEDWDIRLPLGSTDAGVAAQYAGASQWDGLAQLDALRMPTIVIHGEDDQLVPAANGQLIADRIADAELVLLPQANHILTTDQPALVGVTVLDWLTRHRLS